MAHHEISLVVYTLHFQTPLPGGLPFCRLQEKRKGDVTLVLPAAAYVTPTAEDGNGSNLVLQHSWHQQCHNLSAMLVAAMLRPPSHLHNEYQLVLLFCLLEYQPSLPTCMVGCSPARAQSTIQPCLPQRSEHQALKAPFQDVITCPVEFPPPGSQLLVTLPLPSLAMAESHAQRFLINWSCYGLGLGFLNTVLYI